MTRRLVSDTQRPMLGALAVAGVVIAFSLSSTLVKRAESPGVLVAFWRMVFVSLMWNVVLWAQGQRVTLANVRQVWLPGVLLGLNLAAFFAGATHNSVANAALIGSLAPFLIVPAGALLFDEVMRPWALALAIVSFGGLVIVLFNAPSAGDATLRGNVFGMIAMVLFAGYVVTTRRYRKSMDVVTFMATVTPIAAVAILPMAIANGDVFGMSATGWTYTVILTVLTGFVAHGLLVYAQRTVAIGTIGVTQVIQPVLALVWSYLLLDEVINGAQAVGIAIAVGGLLGFLLLNQRGGWASSSPAEQPTRESVR